MARNATYAWSRAKIKQHLASFQKAIFLIKLYQLEGCSSPVALFFRKFVPFVKPTFAMLERKLINI